VVLREFYQDLADPRYSTSFVIYHRRFSTNTMPRWPLAQPMRCLGHNGWVGGSATPHHHTPCCLLSAD
jgi:glutamate synthase (ferredoxin)